MAKRITISTAITFKDPLPEAVDVVIIGGGVVGVFSALYLARAGKKVCLLEKGRIAAEQSSRNWGWIRQHGRDEAELPIVTEALRLWHEVNAETDGACGVRTTGVAYLASSEKEMAKLEDWMAIADRHGVNATRLGAKEAKNLFGDVSNGQWVGGTATLDDAKGEPWQAVPAAARLAHRDGAILIENCAVRSLDIKGGRVAGVMTELGPVRTEQVVLAAGAWSLLFARNHGLSFPQLSVKATALQTDPLPDFVKANAVDEKLAIRRRDDGGYTLAPGDLHEFYIGPDAFRSFFDFLPLLKQDFASTRLYPAAPKHFPDAWGTARSWQGDEQSPFERRRVLEPKPNARIIRRLLEAYKERFPKGGTPTVRDAWAGMIDTTPDVVPILDHADPIPGLIIATGMCGHGFGIGPGIGKIVTALVEGKSPAHDIARFRLSRFTDGTKLSTGPAL